MDEQREESSDPAAPIDPALNYPRGNRLGLRHPRPTVVIVIAVIVLLGGALAYRALKPMGESCSLALSGGNPVAASPEEAFSAWLAAGGATEAFRMARSSGRTPDGPSDADFERVADDRWEWRYAENEVVRVDVDGTHAVTGVNRCSFFES